MPFDMEAVKRVPKPVWIVGGGVILGYVLLKGKGGSGAGAVAGVGSSGGGGGGESDQPALASTDLDQFLQDQAQNQADFLQGLQDAINGGAGGAGGAGGSGGTGGAGGTMPSPIVTTPEPGGGTPTPITSAPSPLRAILSYTLNTVQPTRLYTASGTVKGTYSGTFETQRVKVDGAWHYVISHVTPAQWDAGFRKGQYFVVKPYFQVTPNYGTPSTVLPTAPAPTAPAPITKTVTAAPTTTVSNPLAVRT